MTDIDDESGRVEIAPPKRVRDALPRVHHEHDRDRAAAGMVAAMYAETRMDCPRCGEDVFISLNAELGSGWSCGNCGAHGQVEETP